MSEIIFPRGRYRLTQKALMPRNPGGEPELLLPGTEVIYEGKPGPHMEALDDDAKVAKALAGEQRLDPHNFEPLVGDDDDRLAVKIAEAVSRAMATAIPEIIEKVQAGIAKAQQPKPAVSMAPPPPPPPPPPPAEMPSAKAKK